MVGGIVKRPRLGRRFESGLVYAARLHARQRRKGTNIPYVSHLMSVAALVLENGGGETEAIAGLLHDAIEDQRVTRSELRRRFGDRVARIVAGCTDADTWPKPPWKNRKRQYLAHLRRAPAEVRLVSAADKVHNARAILTDYRVLRDKLWERFNGGREGTLWYYRSLVRILRARGPVGLADELARTVGELERLADRRRVRRRRVES
jgi:GTP pyrophosphokinase